MARQYFIKRNQKGNDQIQWIELTGIEFYSFVNSPESRGRFFIDMDDVVLEATEEQYKKHQSEQKHHSYLRRFEKEIILVSLYEMEASDGCNGEDVISDLSQDTEEVAINHFLSDHLGKAIARLKQDEQWLVRELYLTNQKKTLRTLSAESGIAVMTLCDRKKAVLTKLKKIMGV